MSSHALRRRAQDLQPALERVPRQLLHAVEAAEDERVLRQAEFGAGRPLRHDPLPVVGLVAGQPQHLLGVVVLVLRRDDVRVGDDVVVVGRAHRPGEAQPVDDDRRRPEREKGAAAVAGVAVHVDQDIDAVRADPLRRLLVGHLADVDPVLHGRLDAGVELALVLAAAVVGEHLDFAAVEQLGHQIADRVVAQVRRHIAHADPPAREVDLGVAAVERIGDRVRHGLLDEARGGGQVQDGIVGEGRNR